MEKRFAQNIFVVEIEKIEEKKKLRLKKYIFKIECLVLNSFLIFRGKLSLVVIIPKRKSIVGVFSLLWSCCCQCQAAVTGGSGWLGRNRKAREEGKGTESSKFQLPLLLIVVVLKCLLSVHSSTFYIDCIHCFQLKRLERYFKRNCCLAAIIVGS